MNIGSPVQPFTHGKLGLVLRQSLHGLRLSFIVKDGLLQISSREEINQQRLEGSTGRSTGS